MAAAWYKEYGNLFIQCGYVDHISGKHYLMSFSWHFAKPKGIAFHTIGTLHVITKQNSQLIGLHQVYFRNAQDGTCTSPTRHDSSP